MSHQNVDSARRFMSLGDYRGRGGVRRSIEDFVDRDEALEAARLATDEDP
jgi:hypothetical protein